MREADDGAFALKNGTKELADGADELADGAEKLLDGAEELRDGMKEFNDEGIEKLKKLMETDTQEIIDRLSEIVDAGAAYKSFAGIESGMDGNVKFIIRTDGI